MANAPLIPIPPGYICLSREDYDGIMDRIKNIHDCAYEDLKYKDDEIGFLKKVLEDKQDEILSLQESLDEERKEKVRMLARIDKEIEFNGLWEKKWQNVKDYLLEKGLYIDFSVWSDKKDAVPEEN